MGCDYYILKELRIHYITPNGKETQITIELDRQRCYFSEYNDDLSCDSDDSDYWTRIHARHDKYIEECLRVTFQPRTLYEKGQWKNKETECKYREQVKKQIGDGEIVSIIKQEVRYLR